MDILNIVGSICSIFGLLFAVHSYIKSKNKKKWAVCCSRWLTVLGLRPLTMYWFDCGNRLGSTAGGCLLPANISLCLYYSYSIPKSQMNFEWTVCSNVAYSAIILLETARTLKSSQYLCLQKCWKYQHRPSHTVFTTKRSRKARVAYWKEVCPVAKVSVTIKVTVRKTVKRRVVVRK